MSSGPPETLRVWMPGAFAQLSPALGHEFSRVSAQPIAFAQFRPSGMLAADILAGAPADVYVSANVLWMRRLQRAGRVRHWATLARNRLCLIAVPESGVARLRDLTRPGVRVVAPQATTDPCGRYVERSWRAAGMLAAMRAKETSGELLRSVGSGDLPAFLEDRRAEVGMLYFSDACQLDRARICTVELTEDEDLHDHIRFVIAALTSRGEPFVRWLLAPSGQAPLRAAGFLQARATNPAQGGRGDRRERCSNSDRCGTRIPVRCASLGLSPHIRVPQAAGVRP